MLCARWRPYRLDFNFEARTSRAVMLSKDTFFVQLWDDSRPELRVVAECPLFRGLSAEDDSGYESRLDALCRNVSADAIARADSSVRFGFESALAALTVLGHEQAPHSACSGNELSYAINGLVWMGDRDTMLQRLHAKLDQGVRCVKMKIGGIDFDDELQLLHYIRQHLSASDLELRVDANGAFTPDNVMKRLLALEPFAIHSIEQPIRAGQPEAMADVCRRSAIPVALDEELIGITPDSRKHELLDYVRPAYIILKPALCGGFSEADSWIDTAGRLGIGWWGTSALESNVGLAAIARWLAKYHVTMPQGLGTGELFVNNVGGGVVCHGDRLTVSRTPDFSDITLFND